MKTLLSLIFIFTFSFAVFGATYTVTRSDDRNGTCNSGVDCSLREAVNAANAAPSNDTINFVNSISKITLTSQILISNNGTLAIQGTGANAMAISGDTVTRIFLTEEAIVTIQDVALINGKAANTTGGGAIYVNGGSLILERLLFDHNAAGDNPFVDSEPAGAVFFNGGTHTINNSTISNNKAGSVAGGIFNLATLTITNSTFSGNSGWYNAGGIYNNGNLNLQNVTITNNIALTRCPSRCSGYGGGIYNDGTLKISNSIIAGNISETHGTPDVISPEISFIDGSITSAGNNLIGDSLGDSTSTIKPITYQPTDRLDVNPNLGELQNNGGATPTHALLFGSPAINAGNNSNVPATDQRGFARIVGGIIDIGAFEVQSTLPPPQPTNCSYSITSTTQNFSLSGGTGTITVTTSDGCAYTAQASSESTFVTVTNPNGMGNGTINFTVDANSGAARAGTIFVAGYAFNVIQDAAATRRKKKLLSPTQ